MSGYRRHGLCPYMYAWIYVYMLYIHIHRMERFSAIKKNGILPFAMTWMELECIMLSEISQRKTNTI